MIDIEEGVDSQGWRAPALRRASVHYGSCSRAATPLLSCRAAMIVAQALTTNPVCPRASIALRAGLPHLLSVLIAGGRGRNALRNVIKHPADRAAAGLAACIAE